jgi:predicted ATP-grasp superfamily ATP-dependent carboligase
MSPKSYIVVTDGDERSALAVTRALGRNGIGVIVGAEKEWSLAATSRYCAASFTYPSPYKQPREFADCIRQVVMTRKVDAVFPISDIAMHVIGPEKFDFERHTCLPIPEHKTFEAISDKYQLMKLAMELNVSVPDTIFVPDGDIGQVFDKIKKFPVVVKPACSLVKHDGGWRKTAVQYAQNEAELRTLYDRHGYLRGPSLIQSRVVGEGQGIFVLMKDGVPLAMFAHRRLREKPPSGGVSVLRESIPLDKTLVDPALRLLQHVRWNGVAMVEFKVDGVTRSPILMEINGRFWGSLQLAIDAGMNFPRLLFQMAAGEAVNPLDNNYRTGIKSRWLLGDLDHLLMRIFKSADSLNLPPNYPAKWPCILDFARSFNRATYNEIERFTDIRPAIKEWLRYAGNLL